MPLARSMARPPRLSTILIMSTSPPVMAVAAMTARATTLTAMFFTWSVQASAVSVQRALQSDLPAGQFYQQTGPLPL